LLGYYANDVIETNVKDSPPLLLLTTGALLGTTFPLGKLATNAGISPFVWAWLLLSLCSLVLPNVLIFIVIPHLGSGFTSILFTLSPILTLTLSSIWQVRVPSKLGVFGLLVGFIGAIVVGVTRGELGAPAGYQWVLVGLCIPMTLAIGNIYRTIGWPPSASPTELAIGANLAAALWLLLLIVVRGELPAMADLASHKLLVLVQVVASTAMFSVFFRLQQVGGPTYLSQIGYVAAGLALFVGTVFLGERYSVVTWLGAFIIVIGVGMTVYAQARAGR